LLELPGKKTFQGLAFSSPYPNFLRFAPIGKKKSLAAGLEEERPRLKLEKVTIQELEQN
jgi:hypothetical protein